MTKEKLKCLQTHLDLFGERYSRGDVFDFEPADKHQARVVKALIESGDLAKVKAKKPAEKKPAKEKTEATK
jgi:hypothetical protein